MCALELDTANPDMREWYSALELEEAEAQDVSAATMRATLERSLAAVMVPSCCALLSYLALSNALHNCGAQCLSCNDSITYNQWAGTSAHTHCCPTDLLTGARLTLTGAQTKSKNVKNMLDTKTGEAQQMADQASTAAHEPLRCSTRSVAL